MSNLVRPSPLNGVNPFLEESVIGSVTIPTTMRDDVTHNDLKPNLFSTTTESLVDIDQWISRLIKETLELEVQNHRLSFVEAKIVLRDRLFSLVRASREGTPIIVEALNFMTANTRETQLLRPDMTHHTHSPMRNLRFQNKFQLEPPYYYVNPNHSNQLQYHVDQPKPSISSNNFKKNSQISTNATKTLNNNRSDETRLPSITCWNCLQEGHRRRQCTEPPTVHCYSCGRKGVTKPSCPQCFERCKVKEN